MPDPSSAAHPAPGPAPRRRRPAILRRFFGAAAVPSAVIPVPVWAADRPGDTLTPAAAPSPFPAAAAGGRPGRLRPTPAQMHDIERAETLVREMLAEGEGLRRRGVLMDCLKRFGLARTGWPDLVPWQDWMNGSGFGVLQTPSEFVDYLLYAAERRPRSCLEIGVHTGGVSVFSCAFFQALDPGFRYLGVDIENRLLLTRRLMAPLNLGFRIPCTSEDLAGEIFDIVFIDGDHSYDWARRDWMNVGRHAARLCAFHDINGREYLPKGGGVYRFWRELRAELAREAGLIEIAHAPPGAGKRRDGQWMGIGLVDRGRD